MNKKLAPTGMETESDVEQKLIVKLLTTPMPDGLGYTTNDFRTKADIRKISIDKGNKRKLYYPDYALIIDGIPGVIIEAKTPGADLEEAAREARLYATEINASYPRNIQPCQGIIVTDGTRILGYYWDTDEPFVTLNLDNLNSLDSEFSKFTKEFSKKSQQVKAEQILLSIKSKARYFKPVHMLGGQSVINEVIGDNSFGANISIEYKYLFNPETEDERASIVRNAYVTSKRKLAHVAPIDRIIRAAVPVHEVDAREVSDTGKPKEIIDKITKISHVKNELCLLIGSVGSGKSTFTDYLRLEALPKELSNNTGWVNINLNKSPLTRLQIYGWIVDQAIQCITQSHPKIDFDHIDTLRKIFAVEISKVEKGRAALFPKGSEKYADAIYGELTRLQKDTHIVLRGMINYLYTNQGKLLVIVLDNCDKRNRDDQLLMFEVASWLKSEFPCMVFLPLRDTTYDMYRNEPPLDTVIKDLVFRIDPPLLEKVIYTRLNFAIREIGLQKNKFLYYLPNNMKVECDRAEVASYLKSMIASLFQDQLFKRIITGLAGRNIRKGLEILLDFCKSGHIGEDEILKIRTSAGEHQLPSYVIAKILLKGKRRYYSDQQSNIKNLFHSNETDPLPDPFIRLSILKWLQINKKIYGPNRTMGFHKIIAMVGDLQGAGHYAKAIIEELTQLVEADLVTAENQHSELSSEDLVSISPAGLIHLDLLKNVNYLSAVAEDTLFRENQPAKVIADNISGKGKYKYESRQSTISSSRELVNYLGAYFKNFSLGEVKLLEETKQQGLVQIDVLQEYVDQLVANDLTIQNVEKIESEYPPGTKFSAQIVSIQPYGIFVEFGLRGVGMIQRSHANGLTKKFDELEGGDWVVVEVIRYNFDHKKFDLKLHSML